MKIKMKTENDWKYFQTKRFSAYLKMKVKSTIFVECLLKLLFIKIEKHLKGIRYYQIFNPVSRHGPVRKSFQLRKYVVVNNSQEYV